MAENAPDPSVALPAATSAPLVAIELEHDARVNYAMEQNDVPLVKLLRLRNLTDRELTDLTVRVWVDSLLAAVWSCSVSRLPPSAPVAPGAPGAPGSPGFSGAGDAGGATFNVENVKLQLDPAVLAHQTERQTVQLLAEAMQGDTVVGQARAPIEVLAYNEWAGLGSLPEMLAAFVMPNHPAVEGLLARAAVHLRESTGDGSLNGYQSRSPQRVRRTVEAIYRAVADARITYVAPPASFEAQGQKIRTPEEMLQNRLGTCLDLALLLAACCEQAGLNPLIVIVRGHAFLGVWLNADSFPQPAIEDAARVRKRVQLAEMLVVETTLATQHPAQGEAPASQNAGFDEAVNLAARTLLTTEHFLAAVDLRSARQLGVRPLPLRVALGTYTIVQTEQKNETAQAKETSTPSAAAGESSNHGNPTPSPSQGEGRGEGRASSIQQGDASQDVAEKSLDDLSFAPTTPTPGSAVASPSQASPVQPSQPAEPPNARLERWKRKLLDLSLRNRLINFRETKLSIPLLCTDVAALENALSNGAAFSILPRPKLLDETNPRDQETHRQRTGEDMVEQLLRESLAKRRLHATLAEDALDDRLLDIYRAARTAVEETGANVLYLAVGFLTWYETDDAAEPRRAPILLLPLDLQRKSVREGFNVALGDDEPRINVTLLEKLRVEFGIDVAGLDELAEDEQGLDVPAIMRRFRERLRDIPRWEVRDEACLGLFSFTKFLMWLDLQDRSQELMQSRVVKYLIDRPTTPFDPHGAFPNPAGLDAARPPAQTFCALDADSSQLAAVFAAHDGRSFVLEGPPGTGKSQTITNLIAHCLAHGKRVLFVAEKMAALGVVHRRLSRIGLGAFCLELHSHKSSKREVLSQIEAALNVARAQSPQQWDSHAAKLGQSRAELNQYVEALHARHATGQSVHQVMGRLIALGDGPRVSFDPAWVRMIDAAKLNAIDDAIEQLASAAALVGDIPSHPLIATQVHDWLTTLPQQLATASDHCVATAGEMERAIESLLREARLALNQATGEPGAAGGPGVPSEPALTPALSRGERGSEQAIAAPAAQHAPATQHAPSAAHVPPSQPAPRGLSRAALTWLPDLINLLREDARPTEALLTDPAWPQLRQSLAALIEKGRARDALRGRLLLRYRESLFTADLDALLAQLRKGMTGFFLTAWFTRLRARKAIAAHLAVGDLPPNEELVGDLECAIKLRGESQALSDPGSSGARFFGSQWAGGIGTGAAGEGVAAWDRLDAVLHWCDRFRAHLSAPGSADFDATLRTRCIALATAERDSFAAGAALASAAGVYLDRLASFENARQALVALLLVDEAKALGAATAPGHSAVVREAARRWKGAARQLPDWCVYRRACRHAAAVGLKPLIDALESGVDAIVASQLADVYARSFHGQWLNLVTDDSETLRRFNSLEHERRIDRFAKLDREQLDLAAQFVAAKLCAQVPRVQAGMSDQSEMGILQRQLKLQRRHMPVRKLIQKLPNLLPRLKPCLLMSPLSVAQYLDAAFPPVDVVVFDEASQIPVWDAVGAVARGAQVIIVGDSKQLPPTNFFQKVDDEEELLDEDDFEELESVLDECSASGLPSMRLLWHYRSRHESLITFSNYHYYDNRLQTFPSPLPRDGKRGVSMRHFPQGRYMRGSSRTNPAEAEAIVAEIVARLTAASGEKPGASIGVVTFSIPQQVLIEDLLDEARRKNPKLEPYFTDAVAEPVFVKNLENVQGDERDVILFSICYGPDEQGRVAMNFGPLNRQGGERRLNVAITRAREQVIVYSTLRAEQIDLSRTQSLAVKHLKSFLDYAERGPLAIAQAIALPIDTGDAPLEKAIAAALAQRGWGTELHVGCSGFRIDIAVRDGQSKEGDFVLGVLCDGPFYAAAQTARDRDRLRQSVLENLGWRLIRVWSSDWRFDPQRQIERIEQALVAAIKARGSAAATPMPPLASSPSQGGAAASETEPRLAAGAAVQSAAQPDEAAGSADDATDEGGDAAALLEAEAAEESDDAAGELKLIRTYRAVTVTTKLGSAEEFYQGRSRRKIRDVLLRVIKHEAPLHVDLAMKRVTAFWGFTRVTERAAGHVRQIMATLSDDERPGIVDGFLWPPRQSVETFAGFRVPHEEADELPRRPDEIPTIEYANAVRYVLEQQIGLPADALVRETAKLFGFKRINPATQQAVEAGIKLLEARGQCVTRDGVIALPR